MSRGVFEVPRLGPPLRLQHSSEHISLMSLDKHVHRICAEPPLQFPRRIEEPSSFDEFLLKDYQYVAQEPL